MITEELSYIANGLLGIGYIGAFTLGKRRGRDEAKTETITTLESLVEALKGKVEFLEGANHEKGLLIEKQAVWIEYLRGMVLGGNAPLVPPGTLPDLHGQGRGGGSANPGTGGVG